MKSFKIKETNIIGNPKAEQESNYDLMEVIFIYRSSDEMQNSHLLKNKDIFDYLSSVFSGDVERISDYTDDVNRENISP